ARPRPLAAAAKAPGAGADKVARPGRPRAPGAGPRNPGSKRP
ncbi:ABC transporter permease, partial [Massilia glaciei]